ncbi:MAG: VanW family protein [Firmicutes bacterium]|nr:VanW family protein [Bacillota bacterium]
MPQRLPFMKGLKPSIPPAGRFRDYAACGLIVALCLLYSHISQTVICTSQSLVQDISYNGGNVQSAFFNLQPDCRCHMLPSWSPKEETYGYLTEKELPWSTNKPQQLSHLQKQLGANRLISAFGITVSEPMYEEEINVAIAASYLAGTVVSPGETASLNSIIGPFTAERGYAKGPTYIGTDIIGTLAGGVCKIASCLYNVVVAGDLQVVERHPHSMMVTYVPPGRDATIAWGAKDFRFRNNKNSPLLLWAEFTGGRLYVALYGQFQPPKVEWHSKEFHREPIWSIRRVNPQHPKGTTRVVKGIDAVTVKTRISVRYPGQPVEYRDLGIDSYRALPHILEHAP